MATTQIPVYIPLGMAEQFKALMESNYNLSIERDGWHLSVKETEEEDWGEEGVDWEWEYYDEEETEMEAEAEPKSVVETVNAEAREEEVKEKTKSKGAESKKKRKTSAYQCFCSGSINMMRKSDPELLENLEKNNGLWKHLGAEWQKIKLNVSAFQVYQDQADIINGNSELEAEKETKKETKKRKTSAYQCFCSGSINMMRKSSPELLESLEKSNGLWKHLGAEWQKIKLNVDALQVYQDQADMINGNSSESDSEPEGHVEVEKVLSHHQVAGKPKGRYKIKFVGFKKPEWVDGEDCACDELIQEYWNR